MNKGESMNQVTEIATTAFYQLGNVNHLKAMISARFFANKDTHKFGLHFKGSKQWNCLEMELNSLDLYDLTFYKFNQNKTKVVSQKTYNNVFCDSLRPIFKEETKLELNL